MQTKLPAQKYLRVHPVQLKEWLLEVMKEEKMRFASPKDVAIELERKYGGIASSYLNKIRQQRIHVQDYLPESEQKRREELHKI